MKPRGKPCGSCPYRADCPSGVWDASEYAKLRLYDGETFEQPPGVFMCHDSGDRDEVCRGWLDTHDKPNLLSLRLAVAKGSLSGDIFDLPPSGVPVFRSGDEAASNGERDIERPSDEAKRRMAKLQAKHKRLRET